MNSGRFAAVVALMTIALNQAFAQTELSKQVQADILQARIIETLGRRDIKGGLQAIDEYLALNVPVPPGIRYIEAKAAAETGDHVRAFKSLQEALNGLDRDSSQYKEGITLYPRYQARAEEAQRKLDQKRLAEEAERKKFEEEARAAAQAAAERSAREAREKKLASWRTNGMGALAELLDQMVTIPGGTFQMGSDDAYTLLYDRHPVDIAPPYYTPSPPPDKYDALTTPVHPVTLKPFKISKYEVTFEQYDAFAKATGRSLPVDSGWGRGNRPVINVGWDDAQAFITWLNQQIGGKFRLPSEAEWEFAARAGNSADYPWGEGNANAANASSSDGNNRRASTEPVGSFSANAFGLHDVIGNVWEWTQDCWNQSYVGAPSNGAARLTGECSRRVSRGGSWNNHGVELNVAFRIRDSTSARHNDLGFRLAQDM